MCGRRLLSFGAELQLELAKPLVEVREELVPVDAAIHEHPFQLASDECFPFELAPRLLRRHLFDLSEVRRPFVVGERMRTRWVVHDSPLACLTKPLVALADRTVRTILYRHVQRRDRVEQQGWATSQGDRPLL